MTNNNPPPALQSLLRNPAVRDENGRFQARSTQAAQERREERRHRTLLETIKGSAAVVAESAKRTGHNLPDGATATAIGGVYGAAAGELMKTVSWVKLDRLKHNPKPAAPAVTEATATARNPAPEGDSEGRRPRGRPRNSSNPLAGLQGRARAVRRREIQADNASIQTARELQNLNESTDEATQADKTQHREIVDRLKGIIKAIHSLKPLGGIPNLTGLRDGRGRNGRNGRNTRGGTIGGYDSNGRDRTRRNRNNRNNEDEQRRRDDVQRRWDERRSRRNGGNPPLPPTPMPAPPLPHDSGRRRGVFRGMRGTGVVAAVAGLLGLASIEADDTLTREEKNRAHGANAGSVANSAAGAAAGAAIGTMILPGVGTIIGGLIGGYAADYFAGDAASELGSKIADWIDDAPLSELPGRMIGKIGEWTDELKESAVGQAVIAKVGEWTQSLKDSEIGKYITEEWGALTADISAKWDTFSKTLTDTWENLKKGTEKTLEGVNGWIKDKTGIDVGAGMTAAGAAISNGAAAAGAAVSSAYTATTEAVNEWVKDKTGVDVGAGITAAGTAISNAASSAWDATKGAVASAGDYISGFRGADGKSPQPKITKLLSTEGEKTRVYLREDGSIEKRTGGFASWRNNNPGNLKFEYAGSADKTVKSKRTKEKALKDAQARYDGIVDLDQFGNAIFETVEAGRSAKVKLLTGMHGGKTIEEMLPHYAKDDYTGKANHAAYAKRIHEVAAQRGVDLHGKKIGDLNKAEMDALAAGMGNMEGWKEGDVQIKNSPANPAAASAVASAVTTTDNSKERLVDGDRTIPSDMKSLRIKNGETDAEGRVIPSTATTNTLEQLGVSKFSDLQSKGGQAFAGGYNNAATLYAINLVAKDLGDSFGEVTALNDSYHQKSSPDSEHTKGNKADFTVKNMSGTEADAKTTEILAKYGLQKGVDFSTKNEYDKPSDKSTGGHIDFKLKEAGQKKIKALMDMGATSQVASSIAKPPEAAFKELDNAMYEAMSPKERAMASQAAAWRVHEAKDSDKKTLIAKYSQWVDKDGNATSLYPTETPQTSVATTSINQPTAVAKQVTGTPTTQASTATSVVAMGKQESVLPAIAPVKTPDPLPQVAMQSPAKAAPTHPLDQFKQVGQQSSVIDTASITKAIAAGFAGIKPQQSGLEQSKSSFASHIPVDIDDAYWLRATNGSFT